MKKIFFILIFVSCISFASFGLELSGATHYDNYDGSHTVGFSFNATGEIAEKFTLEAKLDYHTEKKYEAQCLLGGQIKFAYIAAGLAYSIDNYSKNIFLPGIGLYTKINLPYRLKLEGSTILSLAPANLYEAYSFRISSALLFNTDNADAKLKYSLKQSADKIGKIHSLLFDVEAYEKGVPFQLMLGFGTNFLTGTEEEKVQLEAFITGGFSVITKKAGTYFLHAKASPITYRDVNLPFEVRLGAEFKL